MKKWLIIIPIILISLGGLAVYDYTRFHDGKLHITFCDVGQGDAIFIRTPSSKNILVDGGPDKSVLSCISSHMPFWDRTIHELILSHPHQDHFFGMFYVIDRYNTLMFDTEDLVNDTKTFKELSAKLKEKKIPSRYMYSGDKLLISDGITITVSGPSRKYIQSTSPQGEIGESHEFASIISQVTYGSFAILLTGDSQAEGIQQALTYIPSAIDILQAPHHGSKTGLNSEVLKLLDPEAVVISVGKNKYGHPSKEVLKILSDPPAGSDSIGAGGDIKTFRTDEIGDIEIVSDGVTWSVK